MSDRQHDNRLSHLGPANEDSWPEYRRLVLQELERLNTKIESLSASVAARIEVAHQATQISELRIDVATLKTKATLIGGLMGGVAGILVEFVVRAATRGW